MDKRPRVKNFLRLRGLFRLVRIFILVRKLNAVRVRNEIRKRKKTGKGIDMRSPLEKVMEILGGLRDIIDPAERKLVEDINYCIKMISSNRLYEADIDLDQA